MTEIFGEGNIEKTDYSEDRPMRGLGKSKARTLREKLEDQKSGLEVRVKEIDEALNALKSNPGIEELINKINKVS